MAKEPKKIVLEAALRPESIADTVDGVIEKALAGTPAIKRIAHWDTLSSFDEANPENSEYMREDKASGFAESEFSITHAMFKSEEDSAYAQLFGFDVPIES